jgi:thiamine biosynthesis lipoprotein
VPADRAARRTQPGHILALGALLAAALGVLVPACKGKVEKASVSFHAMGGIPIHVRGWDVEEQRFAEWVEAYRLEVQRLEAAMSVWRENSTISKANRAAGQALELDGHTAAVVAAALRWAHETGGAFDPTVGPLVALWKEAEKSGTAPSPAALDRVLQRIGPHRVRLSQKDGRWLLRLAPGTALDLGGLAKGYFADVGVRWLRAQGVARAVVELGGDLAAYDDRPRPQPFRVGVRHPFRKDALLGTLRVDAGGVVTSGDYERGVTIGGKRYNHIIDPRTGRPAEGVHAVTLLAPDGMTADALATGVLVLGPEAGLALVERIEGVEALLVVADPDAPDGWRVVMSAGLVDRFTRE